MPTDPELITASGKTQCQVHLASEKVQGNLPQCSQKKLSQETLSDREGISLAHQAVRGENEADITKLKEKTKLSPGSVIWKKLRDWFLKNKEIMNSQKQNLKS